MSELVKRPVPGAKLADRLVSNSNSFRENLSILNRGLKRARHATERYSFDHQMVHDLGLTAIGGVVLLTYAYLAQQFGLSPASEVILAAGVSGSRGKMDMDAPIVPPHIVEHNKKWKGEVWKDPDSKNK